MEGICQSQGKKPSTRKPGEKKGGILSCISSESAKIQAPELLSTTRLKARATLNSRTELGSRSHMGAHGDGEGREIIHPKPRGAWRCEGLPELRPSPVASIVKGNPLLPIIEVIGSSCASLAGPAVTPGVLQGFPGQDFFKNDFCRANLRFIASH